MKKNTLNRLTFVSFFIMSISIFLISCGSETTFKPVSQEVLPKKEKKLYELELKPLTFEECARCHITIFNLIKTKGGKHQKECTFCHQQFHVYSAKKQNWDAIMPKCQNCHGLKHGEKFPECYQCHSNPHVPKEEILVTEQFAKWCAECHKNVNNEIITYKSKHTDVGCAFCHAKKHGYIPECQACHAPHIEGQTYKDCLTCHKPHSPTHLPAFSADIPNGICGSCHKDAFNQLSATKSKHGKLNCTYCHNQHAYKPKCQSCHGEPHSPEMHKKYPDCLKCHVNAHNLPK